VDDVVVIETPTTPVEVVIPPDAPVCIEVGIPGPPGPPGPPGGGGGQGFAFWPRTLDETITIPDDHTMPTRDLVVAEDGEVIVGTGSELLVL
jgi:hypothetical protein